MNIQDAIKARRTIRKFKQIPLTREQLIRYVDAARLAPSGANLQPLKYYVVQSREMVEKVFPMLKWAGYLAPEYDPKEGERPVAYIVVCCDTSIRKSGYELDAGAAIENLILAALEDGVGACWLGSVDRKALAMLLGIPENLEISSVVALGYPAEAPRETAVENGNIKYYLSDGILCVPKRELDEVLLEIR